MDVWGDGSPIRDFIFSEDVADGMILALYKKINYPINIGSGKGTTIKSLLETIIKVSDKKLLKINWQKNKPSGDSKRLMDIKKATKIGFKPTTNLSDGIGKTIQWYLKNQSKDNRYNSFTEKI